MNLRINFDNLVVRLLPWHKRQTGRVSLLRAFTAPLGSLFKEIDRWRTDTRMIVNVTSQVAVLEGYLRSKYNQPVTIKIVTFDDGAMEVCLEAEGDTQCVFIAMQGEESQAYPTAMVPLAGEMRSQFGDADFIVYIPAGVDLAMVTADIERFKQALTQYKIIQN